MSLDAVRKYLDAYNLGDRIKVEEVSTETVALAARALHVEEARIAKTLAFLSREGDHAIIVVVSGDSKIANAPFKRQFGVKAHMLDEETLMEMTGHVRGGVCPFALPEKNEVYLDVSLKPYKTVFPACGTRDSCIEMTIEELEETSRSKGWVDVCKHDQTH